MPTFDAILPAGGRIDAAFAEKAGSGVKALIQYKGHSIIDRAIRALKTSGYVRRCIVVGGSEVTNSVGASVYRTVAEGASGPDNILLGLQALLAEPDPPEKVLVVTTDLPLLDGQMIRQFIGQCPENRDICVPVISRVDWEARFPNSGSTYVKLRDGDWTIGGCYLLHVKALESCMPQIRLIFAQRKSVVGMAKLLGPRFLLKFLTRNLTVPELEVKVQSIVGCSGAAVRNAPVELAYDIDTLDDYEYLIKQVQ